MTEEQASPKYEWVIHEARIVPELVAWTKFTSKVWVEESESPVALITWHLHAMERTNITVVDQVRTGDWLATRTLLGHWTPTVTIPEWYPAPSPIESIDKLGDAYDRIIFLPRGENPPEV